MRIGTKSVLFGIHQFLLHPTLLAIAWWKLNGFRSVHIGQRWEWYTITLRDGARLRRQRAVDVYASLLSPRLWLAFFVHDLGYIGKPNMDGEEGERHPFVGAAIMRFICGEPWGLFTLYHSRFLAKKHGEQPSALCIADKLLITLYPQWLYLWLANLTGEIEEYMAQSDRNNATGSKYAHMHPTITDQQQWHRDMIAYVTRWVAEHKDGRADTWTPANGERVTVLPSGVLQ